ncbi:hypothetical protein J2Z42_001241 [Clostridium algifaecis]|uniref:Uncharacterized protein n=1 Tax=Clostridium algifaecis TaxID=1472040 RepID=A0ABS4KRB1_9CLOT|nr:hypothetical protein [Clostridium algifaecis]MBP2032569.1 hypothetical protein [Clostridium algifaecis]
MGRKSSKGKRKELTDFSYLLDKDEEKENADNKIDGKKEKEE